MESAIRVADRMLHVSQRPLEAGFGDSPVRARFKVHAAALADLTRLVTLIVHSEGDEAPGVQETIVSTAPGGQGEVLARGLAHRGQPAILVFRMDAAPASLAG